MLIGERIKKVREIRGLSGRAMAAKMKISAQTYSTVEEGVNLKYSMVKKFCLAAEVDPSFLLGVDVPVTEDTVAFFDDMKSKSFLLSFEQLRQKVEVYGDLLNLNTENRSSETAG